ncbi:MAG: ABC transporter permease [Candidatus Binataceae bacterium]
MRALLLPWALPLRFALRELRAGIRGFRIFLACITIGVAAIAGAGSLNEGVKVSIRSDAQPLLGGDLQARLTSRPIASDELAALARNGTVSASVQMRSMARSEDAQGQVAARTLIELKTVDAAYPLYGAMILEPAMTLGEALSQKDGVWGAAIDPSLLTRLHIKLGDTLKIGEATLKARATIVREPDRAVTFMSAGPRVMIAADALAATQLVQTGSLGEYVYNLRLNGAETAEATRERLMQTFPKADWRLRGLNQAAQGLDIFLDNVTLFLTLVGLTALLTGGIGVANAVRAHLASRMNTIATLKCLGAEADTVFAIYLIQLGLLAVVGIVIGLVVGAAIPLLAARGLAGVMPVAMPVEFHFSIYPLALADAAAFGVMTSALFGLWPLARARDVPAVALFRNIFADIRAWPRAKYVIAVGVIAIVLGVYTVATAERPMFALYFVAGAAVALVLFRLAASAVMRIAAKLTSGHSRATAGRPSLRLALANLYRPGAATTTVVLSLGLGLSVLVAIALLESNLDRQIANGLPSDAPSMFFVDIQPYQVEDFTKQVQAMPGVHKVLTASMIRGRITKIGGVPADEARVDPNSRWAVRGERGISTAATVPENAKITAGQWWPADYAGENLVSVDEQVARDFHLGLGDTISVEILGREITAKIASLRDIRWQSGAMNFILIFSPNALAGAPGYYLATVNADAGREDAIENAVLTTMPNVTIIQVREALEMLKKVLDTLGVAVRLTALVALVAGALVLAGAIAAGHARRVYESVVLKVLGATRLDVLKAFVFEYALLGIATGLIAAVVGSIAAWAVVTRIMHIGWAIDLRLIAGVIVTCVLVTLVAGFGGTWRAMGAKAAPLLRHE